MSKPTERCQHNKFYCKVEVYRLTDDEDTNRVTGFTAETTVECMDCKMPFQWIGLDRGISDGRPMMSADGLTLRAPITPLEEL